MNKNNIKVIYLENVQDSEVHGNRIYTAVIAKKEKDKVLFMSVDVRTSVNTEPGSNSTKDLIIDIENKIASNSIDCIRYHQLTETQKDFLSISYANIFKEDKKQSSGYNFDTIIEEGDFTIKIDTKAEYGSFEHNKFGEDGGAGGLWFEKKELIDYDGVSSLPRDVAIGLKKEGFSTSEGFPDIDIYNKYLFTDNYGTVASIVNKTPYIDFNKETEQLIGKNSDDLVVWTIDGFYVEKDDTFVPQKISIMNEGEFEFTKNPKTEAEYFADAYPSTIQPMEQDDNSAVEPSTMLKP